MDSHASQCKLTILVPCLNEDGKAKALGFLERNHVNGEVLVADNGSAEESIQIAEGAGARVIRVYQKGYGNVLMGGIKEARDKYVIMGDSEDSYDLSDLGPFLEKLREGYHLVMGNRVSGGMAPGAMPFLHRWLGNPVLSAMGRLLFRSS